MRLYGMKKSNITNCKRHRKISINISLRMFDSILKLDRDTFVNWELDFANGKYDSKMKPYFKEKNILKLLLRTFSIL